MRSFEIVVEDIKALALSYVQVEKAEFDFESEMQNYLTPDHKFPAVFIAPVPEAAGIYLENVNTFYIDVFCLDILQKSRANRLTILSDTAAIINDLVRDITDGEYEFWLEDETVGVNIEMFNNSRLDYCAGSKARLAIQVPGNLFCEIPRTEDYVTPAVDGL